MTDLDGAHIGATVRLNKYLAVCGVASRRHCDDVILSGAVTVNGACVRALGSVVHDGDIVCVNGRDVHPVTVMYYYMYNKPAGELVTASDDRGRLTVMDRFADLPYRLFPVGRLDYDSEGLLLITNDGGLAHKLLHPGREIPKTYVARVNGALTGDELASLRNGVYLYGDERPTAPAIVTIIGRDAATCDVSVCIHEGRNRQVRRMFEAVGRRVFELKRVSFGTLRLGNLRRGDYRALTAAEVDELRCL